MKVRRLEAKTKIFQIHRDKQSFLSDERVGFFMTEPFLVGVGCGGGSGLREIAETARKAQKSDYRVILIKQHIPGTDYYPLHPEEYGYFTRELLSASNKLEN